MWVGTGCYVLACPRGELIKQKEVERKRRDNINEGIVQIGRLVPTATDKLGKGHVLRLAVQHMTELAAKVEQADSNYARLDEEKQKIQVSIISNGHSLL